MRDAQAKTVYLKEYQPPEFLIDNTELHFQLGEASTLVHSKLTMRRNPASSKKNSPLVLDGQELEIRRLLLDDVQLVKDDYEVNAEQLSIKQVPDAFVLECVTLIRPQKNTSLEGLYKSQKMFCTQCEAQGFRKITYYLDRPDIMSSFTTTIVADRTKYPILLSNGNEVKRGGMEDGNHWITWYDPFKKPAYLFALVAGDLQFIEDHYKTMSGRDVIIRIFVEEKDLDKCDHAMLSLKNAMRWDEQVYGREYDLDIFMIVAVDDFNMGAMENKGLNIFNTSCVLAHPETTTDMAFQRVEAVVAHEYFHNWSGNRVTCRDWFQLSLKEGFTVFRDAEFSADMNSRTVKRVGDATLLRTMQFAEDAGPMSHPVRPDSYIEISNFYTLTVYEKGAELVRMISNLLGPEAFRRGSDLYFERHDGQAVTCDDFIMAMEDAGAVDLTQFRNWYSQSGTPILHISGDYDAQACRYTLKVKQSCPPTPGQNSKKPFQIPMAMGLLGQTSELTLVVDGEDLGLSTVLDITEPEQSFVFTGIEEAPVPSLLRGFSAPVKLHFDYSRDDLLFLTRRDSDGFCRWNACQQLGVSIIEDLVDAIQSNKTLELDNRLVLAYEELMIDDKLDMEMVALMMELPTEAYLAEINHEVDVHAIFAAREFARKQLAHKLQERLLISYQSNQETRPYMPSCEQVAKRRLKNICLSYLMLLDDNAVLSQCQKQFSTATNMTDRMVALSCLVNSELSGAQSLREQALEDFYQRWQNEPLVVNQWFMVQATSKLPNTLDRVKQLMKHEAYDAGNPNKIRSLIGAFCGQNQVGFHQRDGAGYVFLADQIIQLNDKNPQIASRLLGPLTKWRKYPAASQKKMRAQLQRILDLGADLSKDVFEVVSKSLK